MNNDILQGVIILIATRPMQVQLYMPVLRDQLNDYCKVLILDQAQQQALPAEDAQAFDVCHFVETAGTVDLFTLHKTEVLAALIQQYSTQYGPEQCFVFSTDEGNLENIALAGKGLHAFATDFDYTPLLRDKVKMKQHVQATGIRTPRFKPLETTDNYATLCNSIGPELIIKPIDSAGSVDVFQIKNAAEYAQFLATNPIPGRFQVEEFINGTLYHVDSIKKDHQTAVYTINEYLHPLKEFYAGLPSGSIAVEPEHPHFAVLSDFNESVLNAFPINGSFHAEYLVTQRGEVIFLEIACRQAGPPVHTGFQFKTGYWQSALQLDLAMDVVTADEIQLQTANRFSVYIPAEAGQYKGFNLPIPESAYTVVSAPQKGTVCRPPTSCFDKLVEVTVHSEHYAQLYQYFQAIRQQGKLGVFA